MSSEEPDIAVIGAGLSRSGTLSMRAALEKLLEGSCYHAVIPCIQERDKAPIWHKAMESGTLSTASHKLLLTGYKAGVDFPFNQFWPQLMELHPNAKVVLTVRDHKSHYQSLAWLFGKINEAYTWPLTWFYNLLGRKQQRFLLMEESWRSPSLGLTVCESVLSGEEEGIQFLKEWEEYVKAGVPADRLLVFNVKEGWDPLCTFLNLPKPDYPFPRANERRAMNIFFLVPKICAWISFVGLPTTMALLAYFYSSQLTVYKTIVFLFISIAILLISKMLCENTMYK